jgi:hypothetical protein
MVKHCYCAAAALIGALIGTNAPAEWRSDAPRVARSIALAEDMQPVDLTIVYRPYQR